MKNTLKKIISVFSAVILAIAVIMLVVATVARFTGNKGIFGYTMHYVVSRSMEPDITVGDLVIAKQADVEDVEIGDYVVFVSPDPALNKITIIHSVVDIDDDEQGRKLTTSGIKEGLSPDEYPVTDIIGVYCCKSSAFGFIVSIFTSFRNIVFLVIILTAVVVAIANFKNIKNAIKEMKNKDNNDGEK